MTNKTNSHIADNFMFELYTIEFIIVQLFLFFVCLLVFLCLFVGGWGFLCFVFFGGYILSTYLLNIYVIYNNFFFFKSLLSVIES